MNYLICLKGKTEYAIGLERTEHYPMGGLLFAFLDVDWNRQLQSLRAARQRMEQSGADAPRLARECYRALSSALSQHVLLSQLPRLCLERLDWGGRADGILAYLTAPAGRPAPPRAVVVSPKAAVSLADALIALCRDCLSFDKKIRILLEQTPEAEGELRQNGSQRLIELQQGHPELFSGFAALRRKIGVERQLLTLSEDSSPPCACSAQRPPPDAAVSRLCFASEDLRALILLEFESMYENGQIPRKCQNCGGYFLPFSLVSRYCDRPVDDSGRTCKGVAPMLKYHEKISEDEQLKIFRRLNNAYQMRCRRAPDLYPREEYLVWKQRARGLLRQAQAGQLLPGQFEKLIALPKRKHPALDVISL